MKNHQLSIKKYSLYKDSGVEWLGDVPEHWKVMMIKNVYKYFGSGSTPESSETKYYDNGTINWLNTTDLKNNVVNETSNKITLLALVEKSLKIYPINTLAIAMYGQGDTRGSVGLLSIETTTNQAACMMYHSSNSIPKYMFWWFIAKKTSIRKINIGATQPNMNKDFVRNLFISLPPLPEQKAIAQYLDTKTAQCDRKIDLLTQKATLYGNLKQSLINETVTGGLDKSVPMKDSKIEWIGKVPEHWEVMRIKEVAYINKRTLTEKTPKDYKFDYIDIGSVTYGVKGFSSETMTFENAPSRAKRIAKRGDTIISTVRTYLKAITSIDDDVLNLIVSTGFAVISPKRTLLSKYFSYLSTSNFIIDKICALSTGVSYPATNCSAIADLLCLIPPLSEQKAIADYLDIKTAQIDQIIQTINTQIEKLKELRKTLINDVVTGRIKVIGNEQ